MSPPERDQLPPTNAAPFDASTRGVIIGVLVLAFTLSAVRYSYDGVFRALVGSQHDFAVYYAAGKAIRQGENPYDREVLSDIMDDPKIVCYGLYPPFLAILLIPLTYLSVASASLVWFCGSHLCLIVCVAIVPLAFPSLPRWVVWLPAAWIMMNLWPVGFSLDVGNVNVPLLLILTLAFCAHARRREWTAGALLSVAAMIKLHPVLFVPYALWTRQYKLCVAICLGCCIILGASVGVAGVPVHQSWLEGLWQFGSEGSQLAADNSVVHPANQSVAAFWARLMVPNEHTTPWWNAPEAAQWLNVGVCATLWLLTMAFCSRRPAPEHVRRLEFGAFVTLAVVASTQSWEHHYSLLFIQITLPLITLSRLTLNTSNRALIFRKALLPTDVVDQIEDHQHFIRTGYPKGVSDVHLMLIDFCLGDSVCWQSPELILHIEAVTHFVVASCPLR